MARGRRARAPDQGETRPVIPLLLEAGEALADYVLHARPRNDSRRLFLHHVAPVPPINDRSTISRIVRAAMERAGIELPRVAGAHRVRHSLATRLVGQCPPINEVADLLGHAVCNSRRCAGLHFRQPTQQRRSGRTLGFRSPESTGIKPLLNLGQAETRTAAMLAQAASQFELPRKPGRPQCPQAVDLAARQPSERGKFTYGHKIRARNRGAGMSPPVGQHMGHQDFVTSRKRR